MKISFAKPELPEAGSLAVAVMDGRKLGLHAAQVDKLTKGGVTRAMGASRRFTLRMVLAEAAGIGVVGGVLGLMFGLTDQWMFSLVSGDMMNFQVHFRPSPMALVFTVGALAISLLGSVPPARRAARLNIIEAVGVE